MSETQPFTARTPITAQQIADQFSTAVEGGISYWASGFNLVEPERKTLKEKPWYADPKLYEGEFRIRIIQQEEHLAGAGLEFFLTRETVQSGLDVLATKYGHHISDIVGESGDADTADAFVQCCLFGDIVYG